MILNQFFYEPHRNSEENKMEKTLLIVSDDRQERDSIAASIRKGHSEPVSADSALEGMGRFRDFRPSIAIVNFDMPGGQELIDSIMSENPAVQIIVLCGTQSLDLATGRVEKLYCRFSPAAGSTSRLGHCPAAGRKRPVPSSPARADDGQPDDTV